MHTSPWQLYKHVAVFWGQELSSLFSYLRISLGKLENRKQFNSTQNPIPNEVGVCGGKGGGVILQYMNSIPQLKLIFPLPFTTAIKMWLLDDDQPVIPPPFFFLLTWA